jgi:hypothetical protein
MIPEIDVQLAAVAKSLADNIHPAIDPANAQAQEQMQLCLATLAIVRQRLPDLQGFLKRDLADNLALLRALGGEEADVSGDFESRVRRVKTSIADLIDTARGTAQEKHISAVVLAAQGPMILRSRAWTIGMGFEPDPAQIPDLSALLAEEIVA